MISSRIPAAWLALTTLGLVASGCGGSTADKLCKQGVRQAEECCPDCVATAEDRKTFIAECQQDADQMLATMTATCEEAYMPLWDCVVHLDCSEVEAYEQGLMDPSGDFPCNDEANAMIAACDTGG